MDYFIIPDQETECSNDFPDGLSFFFEQVGGYDDASEVSQISALLQIDLSAFQHYTHFEEMDERGGPEEYWQAIEAVEGVIDELLRKLAEYPAYYRAIRHRSDTSREALEAQLQAFAAAADDAEQTEKLLAHLPKMSLNPYPPDYGYLSGGGLLQDLRTLQQTLACYRQHGVRRIMLVYA